jgi:hypothetical protein
VKTSDGTRSETQSFLSPDLRATIARSYSTDDRVSERDYECVASVAPDQSLRAWVAVYPSREEGIGPVTDPLPLARRALPGG